MININLMHGLYKKKCGQQVKGSNFPPLLCSYESPPGVLHSALRSPEQDRHGPQRGDPEMSNESDQRPGTLLP